jgi:hypothetical protein
MCVQQLCCLADVHTCMYVCVYIYIGCTGFSLVDVAISCSNTRRPFVAAAVSSQSQQHVVATAVVFEFHEMNHYFSSVT